MACRDCISAESSPNVLETFWPGDWKCSSSSLGCRGGVEEGREIGGGKGEGEEKDVWERNWEWRVDGVG